MCADEQSATPYCIQITTSPQRGSAQDLIQSGVARPGVGSTRGDHSASSESAVHHAPGSVCKPFVLGPTGHHPVPQGLVAGHNHLGSIKHVRTVGKDVIPRVKAGINGHAAGYMFAIIKRKKTKQKKKGKYINIVVQSAHSRGPRAIRREVPKL
ncbi:hypothetical protein NDU88_008914 [Pleurodeles waltl]|uniref:Uncharacterized protein n=1 Tax=Pleurodeles waltl TaxID=8319 RepID=A0AAV7QTW6_PLEWA|nr:hypothetical protein NDU88_008914 [Pleurodeles waltl]